MKHFLFLLFLPFLCQAQMLRTDSSTSMDGRITLFGSVPSGHKAQMMIFLENQFRIYSSLLRDTTTADTFRLELSGKQPGTYAYQIMTRRWSSNPCTQPFQISPVSYVRVGAQACRTPLYLNVSQANGAITYTVGLCPSCSTYSVVFRRLASTNPSITPLPDQNIQASGTRQNGYRPTASELLIGLFTRSSETSFRNQWYQVDAYCGGPTIQANRITRLIFVQ